MTAMTIYVLLIALLYLSKWLFDRLPGLSAAARRWWFVVTAMVLWCIVCGLRDDTVGTDIENYLIKFIRLRDTPWQEVLTHFYTERVEIGFAVLNKLVGLITPQPHAVIFVSTALFAIGTGRFIYRYTDDVLIAVIVLTCCGYYLYAFNITRQMIAVAILLNAWGELTERRVWSSAVLFGLSVLFHVTSLVFLVTYVVYALRNRRVAVGVTLGIGAVLLAGYRLWLKLLSHLTDAFSYLDNSQKTLRAGGIWLLWGVELTIILLFLAYYILQGSVRGRRWTAALALPPTEPVVSLCYPLFTALYIAFSVLGTQFNNLDRLGVYFLPFCVPMFLEFRRWLRTQAVWWERVYLGALHGGFVGFFLFFSTNLPHYRYAFFWQ